MRGHFRSFYHYLSINFLAQCGEYFWSGITTVVLVLLLISGSGFSQTQETELWEDDVLDFNPRKADETNDELPPDEIREPFFSLVMNWAAEDSLGTWSAADVTAYAKALGRESKLPVDKLVSFSRQHPTEAQRANWPNVEIRAIWNVDLGQNQAPPMPYSILGYHPGTLRISGILQLAEIQISEMDLVVDGINTRVTEVQMFRLQKGTMVLDVDGWLDILLGSKLDDAAVVAFVAGRENGSRVSLAVSLGKKGRNIYGEFDLNKDKALANGRPFMTSFSAVSREILYRGVVDPLTQYWGKK